MANGDPPGLAAPKYTVQRLDLEGLDAQYLTDQACIIDFGESYDMSSPPSGLGTPEAYRSPELIFDNSVGIGCDIWAFACTLYEIRSRRSLFETYDGTDDDVLSYMVRLLGKLPEPWWSSWEARSHRFDEDGKPTGEDTFTIQDLLEDSVQFRIGDKNGRLVDIAVPPEERNLLADLILRMLKYEPKERATIDSVIDHPWFKLS